MKKKRSQKVRNYQAVAAWFRNSGGAMGGSVRQKTKKERKEVKQNLRRYDG